MPVVHSDAYKQIITDKSLKDYMLNSCHKSREGKGTHTHTHTTLPKGKRVQFLDERAGIYLRTHSGWVVVAHAVDPSTEESQAV